MRAGGYNIGGEQSGHIVLADHATTGDGLIAALQVLAELVTRKEPAHRMLKLFDPLPQLLKNVRFSGGKPLEDPQVKQAIADAEKELEGTGRLVIRKSGTEPLIRVMAEGENDTQVSDVVDRICDAVRKAA
jgi:phosphoglucosamine mutase